MPFGTLQSSKRLGISNVTVPNAASFGETVLRLLPGFLVYQGQMVHSTAWTFGPGAAAGEWCGSVDNEKFHQITIRQVSAHDTVFARRNLSVTPQYAFAWHRANSYNQIYYAGNEPNAYSALATGSGSTCANDCWNPRDRIIDNGIAGCFPDPNTQFWETGSGGFSGPRPTICTHGTDWKRIRPEALALLYLRIKREAESLGRGHVVLPPSAIHANFGFGEDDEKRYWRDFYNAVRDGVSIGSCAENGITPDKLKVLHVHHYAELPKKDAQGNLIFLPRESVGYSASMVRKGADWYRGEYNNGAALRLDILLSETGPRWDVGLVNPDLVWSGGWPDFRTGLAWWNTWLCWLLRTGPRDCNLLNWNTGEHTIHACIHEASIAPMATNQPSNGTRHQWYFNTKAWDTYWYDAPVIDIPSLQVTSGNPGYPYERSFSISPISWGGKTWYTTPFGACFTVWSRVGTLPVTGNLNTGWVSNTQEGAVGKATFSLQPGWNTVYFPVIKNTGTFPQGTSFFVQWLTSTGDGPYRGQLSMDDFENSGVHSNDGYNQYVYMSMVYPVVSWVDDTATEPRTVKIQLSRNKTGPEAWLGPPVVLPGVCSWFIYQ